MDHEDFRACLISMGYDLVRQKLTFYKDCKMFFEFGLTLREMTSLACDRTFGISSRSLYRVIFLKVCLLLCKNHFTEPEHILLFVISQIFIFPSEGRKHELFKTTLLQTVVPSQKCIHLNGFW